MIKIDGWICTDPDTLQFAKHYEKFSRFKEFDRVNYLETFKALYENLTYGKLNIIMPELFNTNMFTVNEKHKKANHSYSFSITPKVRLFQSKAIIFLN